MAKLFLIFVLLALPAIVSAQGVGRLLLEFGDLIDTIIPILVAIGLLVFLWGLVKFIFRVSGDEKAVEGGKRLMFWGIIALFVMVSVWGIIYFLEEAFLPGPSSSPGATPPGTGGGPRPGTPGPQPPFSPFP